MNSVQYRHIPSPTRQARNPQVSTLDHKERIIQAAYSIGARGGLAAISARAVAEDAGVSVGYLYKVFPSKSDITVAAARRYFEFSLSQELCRIDDDESFVEFCRRLWEQTKAAFVSFHHEWLRDHEELPKQDLIAAHEAMGSVLAHARTPSLKASSSRTRALSGRYSPKGPRPRQSQNSPCDHYSLPSRRGTKTASFCWLSSSEDSTTRSRSLA